MMKTQSYPYDMLLLKSFPFYPSRALNHLFGGRTQVDAATAQMTRAGNALHLHRNPSLVERSFLGGVGEQKSKQNKQVGYGKYRNMYILSIYVYRERERESTWI